MLSQLHVYPKARDASSSCRARAPTLLPLLYISITCSSSVAHLKINNFNYSAINRTVQEGKQNVKRTVFFHLGFFFLNECTYQNSNLQLIFTSIFMLKALCVFFFSHAYIDLMDCYIYTHTYVRNKSSTFQINNRKCWWQ